MTIVFYHTDGSKRVLRPMRSIPEDMVRQLAREFRAVKYEIK